MIELNEIQSVSIDMSTEKTPYNRIYAKPIERQGDVLLCEFESANYDIEQKALKAELENRMNLERQLYKYVLEENAKLKELLKECQGVLLTYSNMHGNYELYDKIDEVLNADIKRK